MTEAPFITFTIQGEIASKANSRRLVRSRRGVSRFVLSDKAKSWSTAAKLQVRRQEPLLQGELAAWVHAYYRTERPDLDVELLWDVLQGRVYENDRQVREKHIFHGIDKDNPRVLVLIGKRDDAERVSALRS